MLIILLRYGSYSPREGQAPIMNVTSVAQCVGLSPSHVTRILKDTCHRILDSDKGDRRRWRKLQNHHVTYLVSSSTLHRWSHLSLIERSVMFQRQFTETSASASTISRVFKLSRSHINRSGGENKELTLERNDIKI